MRRFCFRADLKKSYTTPVLTGLVVLSLSTMAFGQTQLASSDASIRRSARKVTAPRDLSAFREHALWPALELAMDSYKHMRRNVRDYSCSVVRRERVNGKLRDREFMTAKVRNVRSRNGQTVVPFGVYLKFMGPARVKGREVLFVDGQYDGEMFVRNGGKRFAFVTTKISPDSDTAMTGNRYPITEFGIENLVKRLIEVVQEDIRFNVKTNVEFFNDAMVDGRSCTGIRVTHPEFDERLRFHSASVFMDNELKVPVHYEAYGWPKQASEKPPLLEQYTYRDIRLNVGFTQQDFDPSNPSYKVK